METAPSEQPVLALPKWECPLPSTRPHPNLPRASGEFNSYDADHREFVRPLCYLLCLWLIFLFSIDISIPSILVGMGEGTLEYLLFLPWGPQGPSSPPLVTPKAKGLATSPLAREVPTPLLSTQLRSSWRFQGSSGEVRGKQGKLLTLYGQLPD